MIFHRISFKSSSQKKKQICHFLFLYYFFFQNSSIENNFEKYFIGCNSNHSTTSKYKFAPAASQIWFARNSTRLWVTSTSFSSHFCHRFNAQDVESYFHDPCGRLKQKHSAHVDFHHFTSVAIFLHAVAVVVEFGQRGGHLVHELTPVSYTHLTLPTKLEV